MAGRSRETRDRLLRAVRQGFSEDRLGGWVHRYRRRALPDFLTELARLGPEALLADPAGQRDARHHLLGQWPESVRSVARPDSLPEVIEHRQRVRVHPAAPGFTAAAAGVGSAVVANSSSGVVEVFGVAGVVALSAAAAAALWRPRARRRDRQFTVTGTRAVVARAELEIAEHGLMALDSAPVDAQLGVLIGASRMLEQVEGEALTAGLLDHAGVLTHPPATPAEQSLVDEVLTARTELVNALLRLTDAGHADRARQREQERGAYRHDDRA